MSRTLAAGALVAATAALLAAPAHAESGTVRIEPRPFYGATVSMEAGVRVFRPLPADRYVVINPGNATPLSLGINDTRVYEQRTNYNYNYGSGGGSRSYGSGIGTFYSGRPYFRPGAPNGSAPSYSGGLSGR